MVARRTSAGTAPATRTGWPVRQSRSGARIVVVADAFCAMTAGPALRRGTIGESARRSCCVCSGTQFDPDVVTAFIVVLDGRNAQAQLALA